MHDFVCIDETFDPNFTIEYKLSIQVSLDGFSFCILDDIRKKYLLFKHIPFRLSNPKFLPRKVTELLEDDEILSNRFKSVKILIDSPHFSAIPRILDSDQKPETYLRQNFTIPKNTEFQIFHADFFNCSIVYSYASQLKSVFDEKFEAYNITHQIEPVFNRLNRGKLNNEIKCFLNVSSQYFTVLIFENDKVLFLNSFNYKNEQDFLYYLLTSFKALGLKPEETKTQIAGQIIEQSALHKLLATHFINLDFSKLNTEYQYSYTFDKLPQHQFLNIINPEG